MALMQRQTVAARFTRLVIKWKCLWNRRWVECVCACALIYWKESVTLCELTAQRQVSLAIFKVMPVDYIEMYVNYKTKYIDIVPFQTALSYEFYIFINPNNLRATQKYVTSCWTFGLTLKIDTRNLAQFMVWTVRQKGPIKINQAIRIAFGTRKRNLGAFCCLFGKSHQKRKESHNNKLVTISGLGFALVLRYFNFASCTLRQFQCQQKIWK